MLSLWVIASHFADKGRLFPTPWEVAAALSDMLVTGELVRDVVASARRALVGFVVGGTLGILMGYATGRNRLLDDSFGSLFQMLRPLPPISLVPLLILWLGINEPAKYVLVSFGVFFPVWINTHQGTRAVDPRYIWMAQSLGASRQKLAFEVILPAALPMIVSGLRTSIGVAFFCLVAAELAGAMDGVVFRMNLSQLAFRVDRLIAGLLVLGSISLISDTLFVRFINVAFPWLNGPGNAHDAKSA